MSRLVSDETLLDDMAAALLALRKYFMQIAEQHPDMDTSVLDGLLRRYEQEARP